MKKLGFVILIINILVLVNINNVFGDCTPGSRAATQDWGGTTPFETPWLSNGSGDSAKVPMNAFPSVTDNFGNGCPINMSNYKCYSAWVVMDGYKGNNTWGSACNSKVGYVWYTWGIYNDNPGIRICKYYNPQTNGAYVLEINFQKETVCNETTKDYDCDGIKDYQDATPIFYFDDDDDGIANRYDPWPNDGNFPGENKFVKFLEYTRKSDGKKFTVYVLKDDPGNENYWIYTSDGISISEVNDTDFRVDMFVGGVGKTFSEWGFGEGQAKFLSDEPSGSVSQGSFSVVEGGSREGGKSGSSSYGEIVDDDLKIVGDYLAGIQDNTGGIIEGINSLISGIENLGKNLAQLGRQTASAIANSKTDVNIDMTGVEGKLDDIKNKIPYMGSENEIEGANSNSFSDGSDEISSAIQGKEDEIKEGLINKFSSLLSNNPINSIVSGSGVQLGNGQCALTVQFGNFSFDLDFCPAESYLNILGVFLVAFSGLLGMIEVLRG